MKIRRVVVALVAICTLAAAGSRAAGKVSDAPEFSKTYKAQHDAMADSRLDAVIQELRGTIEKVAGRGSHVQAASTQYRVEGFERLLLRRLRKTRCPPRGARPPDAAVIAKQVMSTGARYDLTLDAYECGQVTAFVVLVLEKAPAKRLCESSTLNELLR